MSSTRAKAVIRQCAQELLHAAEQFDADLDGGKLRNGLLEATRPLLELEDLFTLGSKRAANHIDNSKFLYYDGTMHMTLDEFPKGKFVPPHDHGVWEAIVVCTGRLKHTLYERIDDGSVERKAQLKIAEEVELTPGEITMVVPPSDIHSFEALSDNCFVITIVGGDYSILRHYYNLRDNSYTVRVAGTQPSSAAA